MIEKVIHLIDFFLGILNGYKNMIDIIWKTAVTLFAIIGIMVTILKFFSLSTKAINWWQGVINRLAKQYKTKKLRKNAIKSKIEAIVNSTVFDLQKELPHDWIKKMKIEWVNKSTKRLSSGQKIIRIEAEERQDFNIINGIYNYFNNTLFPTTFEVIPFRIQSAISLRLSYRTIFNSKEFSFLEKVFTDTIMEREIQNDENILIHFDPFTELDKRGFLTGALIREVDEIASKIRLKKERIQIEEIIKNTTNHMMIFTDRLKGGKGAVAEIEWHYSNEIHTYRFLLAKRQNLMKVDNHLKRSIDAYNEGVDRLYVFGTYRDIAFTQKLIRRIELLRMFIHIETFDVDRDYNSNKKGIGALFIKNINYA